MRYMNKRTGVKVSTSTALGSDWLPESDWDSLEADSAEPDAEQEQETADQPQEPEAETVEEEAEQPTKGKRGRKSKAETEQVKADDNDDK